MLFAKARARAKNPIIEICPPSTVQTKGMLNSAVQKTSSAARYYREEATSKKNQPGYIETEEMDNQSR